MSQSAQSLSGRWAAADIYMLSGDHDNIMGFGWAAANANIQVLLQEGGGGGTLGKAMALHMAAVMPTHSAHLICLDDQCTMPPTTAHPFVSSGRVVLSLARLSVGARIRQIPQAGAPQCTQPLDFIRTAALFLYPGFPSGTHLSGSFSHSFGLRLARQMTKTSTARTGSLSSKAPPPSLAALASATKSTSLRSVACQAQRFGSG